MWATLSVLLVNIKHQINLQRSVSTFPAVENMPLLRQNGIKVSVPNNFLHRGN